MARSQSGFYSIQVETEKFRRATQRFVLQNRDRAADTVQAVALNLANQLYKATPVDTGQAAGGWLPVFVALNVPTPARRGTSETQATIGFSDSDVKVSLEGKEPTIIMTNGVEHNIFLEFGHSDQAPNGYFRRTMAGMRRAFGKEWARQARKRRRVL